MCMCMFRLAACPTCSHVAVIVVDCPEKLQIWSIEGCVLGGFLASMPFEHQLGKQMNAANRG